MIYNLISKSQNNNMSSKNSKNTMGMSDFSNIRDDHMFYIKVLFEKNQRLEKEREELKKELEIFMAATVAASTAANKFEKQIEQLRKKKNN